MSHYAVIQTEFKYKDCLIAALKEIYGSKAVEVYEKPVNLIGYQGDIRKQKAHIVVRRKYIGPVSNDLGFLKDGETDYYSMIISDYDRAEVINVGKVITGYVKHVVKSKLPGARYKIKSTSENQLVLEVRR